MDLQYKFLTVKLISQLQEVFAKEAISFIINSSVS